MSANKPVVCLCCKKSYYMPAILVPLTVAPWSEYGICDKCDNVVINGRLLERVNELNQSIGDQFDNPIVDEISEITLPESVKSEQKVVKVRAPRKSNAMPKQEETPPVKALPVFPKVFTPAAKAQLSLFNQVINMANALF